MRYIIGVDVGGTHTDAVVIDGKGNLLSFAKAKTTRNIHGGFEMALQEVLKRASIDPEMIDEVRVGTTHATNALLEAKDLIRVGVLRLSGEKGPLIPVAFDWPEILAKQITCAVSIPGGMECTGEERMPLDLDRIDQAIQKIVHSGAESMVIISSFSPLNPSQEQRVKNRVPLGIAVSCSYEMSGLGFIERENTTILNALLQKVLIEGFSSLRFSLEKLGIKAPLFLTQNEGSIMTLEEAMEKPILTLSSGQTNSFIGAAKILKVDDAVVVDIGGTTTDIGVVKNGFPRRTIDSIDIAGIPLNFPMPDVVSMAIGGGSMISAEGVIGPQSCGGNLFQSSQSFGGSILTLTDLALRAGVFSLEGADPSRIELSKEEAIRLLKQAFSKIDQCIKTIHSSIPDAPVIVVGGGASLFGDWFAKAGYLVPKEAAIANAYGSALAEISATIDENILLDEYEAAIDAVKSRVIKKVCEQGAEESSTRITRLEIIPYQYMSGRKARVVAAAAGNRKS